MKKILLICFSIAFSFLAVSNQVSAITNAQSVYISEYCESIIEQLKTLQHSDSRTRVYLGRYYEIILNDFMVPLNLRLVKNNLSDADLSTDQQDFATAKANFSNDFISYQKDLENLISINCKKEPETFYKKLVDVRAKREGMIEDVSDMKKLYSDHLKHIRTLRGRYDKRQ